MTAEALGNLLAPLNAGLNLTSTACLLVGFAYIRKKKRINKFLLVARGMMSLHAKKRRREWDSNPCGHRATGFQGLRIIHSAIPATKHNTHSQK